MQYSVLNVFADLYEFQPIFNSETIDIDVRTIYESSNRFSIVLTRLNNDDANGWDIDINVLVWYRSENRSDILNIGRSEISEKRISIDTDFLIYPGDPLDAAIPYKMIEPGHPNPVSREEFNRLFNTDIVLLPAQLYAVGTTNNTVYMYNEKYIMFHEIMKSINHILRTYLTYRNQYSVRSFCFIICAADGYMEYHYPTDRSIPRLIGETEYQNKDIVTLESPHEYAVFSNKIKYVLTQSYQSGSPDTIGIPDRHYFYCNLYNPFRSFHKGMPFSSKISKVAFVARKERGTKYNFTNRRDIEINQREYFFSDNVSKKNVECSIYWVDSKDLVKFKYILDIDGMAATWDATAWKMNSGSVLFKTDSCWKQWFYDDFLPWKNYIPIRDDFSDIDEKFEWCESNPEECQKIIENNLNLFQKVYRYQNVIDYTIRVIDIIHR